MLRGRRVLVLDVRRHDERTLYGAIPGALHLPGGAHCMSVILSVKACLLYSDCCMPRCGGLGEGAPGSSGSCC
jgi:hypothetical protein